MNSTEDTTSSATDGRPSALETAAVLISVIASATASGMTAATFVRASIAPSGDLDLQIRDEATATLLAATLGLPETERGESIEPPWAWEPEGTPDRLRHHVRWEGTHAGHHIRLVTLWHTPLPDPIPGEEMSGPVASSDGQGQ